MATNTLTDQDKALVYTVDIQTSMKFTGSKKLKTWLSIHPNFKKQGKQWIHIYDDEAVRFRQAAEDLTQTQDNNNA